MSALSEEDYYYKLDNMVLISSEHLRTLFQARWKKESGSDWGQSENQGEDFIQGVGQAAYNNAMHAQKVIIAKGCVEDWDISVLSTVLTNFGDWRTYKSENAAVRQLTTLRNTMAHHPSKKLSVEEYNAHVKSFRLSMQGLGVSDEEIEQAIQKAGRSSSVAALKSTKRLYDRARGLMKNNKFEQAIECYDEAITMPSLLPIHQATAFEKRAECYIKFGQYKKEKNLNTEVDECCNMALMDAERALEVNSKSWKAVLAKGQAHRLKREFQKAVDLCRQSLKISPAEQQVQNELASCMSLLRIEKGGMGHLEPQVLPKSLDDKLAQYSKAYGRNITEKEFLEIECSDKSPGHEFYFRGRQYQFGWGVRQNEVEAARCFTKGAALGCAEAIHSLGFFYTTGQGVVQDVSKAFELYQKAAQMPPTSPGGTNVTGCNVGVAAAQHDLGVMYHQGIFVEEDIIQAAKWYGKAAENGDGRAAHAMGEFYMNGMGVPRNEKLGECHFIQAIRFGEASAAHALVIHYKMEMEPEKALKMFKTGREMGYHGLAGISEDEFMVEFRKVVKNRDKLQPELDAFEKQHKLDPKGMTFMERRRRMKNISEGKPSSYSGEFPSNPEGNDWQLRFADSEQIKKWKTAAENGSTVAAGLMTALEASTRVMKLVANSHFFKNEKEVELLNALYDRLSSEHQHKLRGMHEDTISIIKKPVEDLFKRQHGKKGDVEMKARLCYVEYNLKVATGKNMARGMELLQEGITMYPNNVNYYNMLAHLHMNIHDFKSCFATVKKGLKKFPDNVPLLLLNATLLKHLKSSSKGKEQVFAAYNDFLSKAPKDHPLLHWVYYELANSYLCTMYYKEEYHRADELRIETYYMQGKEAEKRILALGLSVEANNPVKENLEMFLGLKDEDDGKTRKPVSTSPPQPQDETVLQRKPYLENPVRKRLILRQRELIDKMITDERAFLNKRILKSPKLTQTAPKGMLDLKSINLADMSSSTDVIHHDCFIDLTNIDVQNIRLPFVQLVAEDENGDTVSVFIHHVEITKNNFERLRFGRRISILNPYMQIGLLETESGIRVDDQDCLVYLGGVTDMCRFCGEENAKRKCGNCKKAMYCSKECQEYDWKILKHKRICSHIKNEQCF